ncbi:MAG: hypothetical protein R6V01_05635 [Thermoplasmatota archaeon]
MIMISAGLVPVLTVPGGGSENTDLPSRSLQGYEETLNVSLPKPDLYGDTDPHYNHDNLESNTWEDVAIVVLLQDRNKVEKRENQGTQSTTAKCSDIYQAAFVPLDGKTVSTGTQQRVMVEDFTATWCGYCTGVIGAMNRLDMDETMFPDNYIGVEWHSGGGTYGTGTPYDSAVERRDSYEIEGGIPRYIIDGMDPWVGGSTSANASSIDTRIRNSIDNRGTTAPISIQAHAGHTSNDAWVEFTFTVESAEFDNDNVDAHVFLVQDAYPRRHGTNPEARLGWIGQDIHTQRVLQLEPPVVQFRESSMLSEINELGYVEKEFDIKWQASDKEDGTQLEVDLYYRQKRDPWTIIASSLPNTGSFGWDTLDPRVPDGGGYELKIVVKDSDGLRTEVVSDMTFEINNPDPPTVSITEPTEEGTIMTGNGEVGWNTWDEEQDDSQITIDLWLSSDEGENYDVLADDVENTGLHVWDTTEIADGDTYMIKIRATDITGLYSEVETPVFEIFNNDPPAVDITFPEEGATVSGEIEITWDSIDEEDEPLEMRYELSLRFVDEGVWMKLVSDEVNSGSFTLDTEELDPGDGAYNCRVVLRDTNGEYSEPGMVSFEVMNPDAPVIFNTMGPRKPVSGTATFSYSLSDPDRGESALLAPSFYLSTDGSDWELLEENHPNTGTFELDVLEMEDREYYLKILVPDPTVQGLEAEFIYPAFEVNNPDAPVIEGVSLPSQGDNITGEVSLSWSGSDADGDMIRYFISYSPMGDPTWYPIADAQGITESSYSWNTSEMTSGQYQLRILARDDSRQSLEAEIVTDDFRVHVPEEADDDDTDGGGSGKGTVGEEDSGLLFIVMVAGIAVILLMMIALAFLVILRRRNAAPPMKAPPASTGQPGLPPQQAGALPPQGQVSGQRMPAPPDQSPPPPSG